MIYHLNKFLDKNLTGIEHAALIRQKLLKKCQIQSKIITVEYNNHNYKSLHGLIDSDVVNMYDHFQKTQNVDNKNLYINDVFPTSIYTVKKTAHKNLYSVYEKKFHVAFVQCFEDESISYIHYYSRKNGIKRSMYDSRGFLSCEIIYTTDQNIRMEVFYTPFGEAVLEKHYEQENDKAILSLIRLKNNNEWRNFFSESELITFFMFNLLNNGDLVIIDRNIVYADSISEIKKKAKVISVIHSTHTEDSNYISGKIKNHYKKLFDNINNHDCIIVSTEGQRQDIIKRFSNEEKIHCIPVGFRKPATQIKKDNKAKIVSIGRLSQAKRQDHIIKAFNEIVKEIPEAELHIFGFGNKEKELRKLVDDLKLSDRVLFRGYLPNLDEELKKSKLILLTSTEEGFCLALLEAASYGIPAVSYDIKYGPKDIIENGKTGYLTPENPSEMAEHAVELLSDNDLFERFSKNAYTKSFAYSEEVVLEKWKNLIEGLI